MGFRGEGEHVHRFRRALAQVAEEHDHHAVVQIGRELDLARRGFGFAAVAPRAHLVATLLPVEGDLELLRESGSALYEVVAPQREDLLLREDHRLIVEGAVAEAEQQARVHALRPDDLQQIALCECLAARAAEHQEAAGDAFEVADRDRRRGRGEREGDEESDRAQRDGDECPHRPTLHVPASCKRTATVAGAEWTRWTRRLRAHSRPASATTSRRAESSR
jgi:hypothetical protein